MGEHNLTLSNDRALSVSSHDGKILLTLEGPQAAREPARLDRENAAELIGVLARFLAED